MYLDPTFWNKVQFLQWSDQWLLSYMPKFMIHESHSKLKMA